MGNFESTGDARPCPLALARHVPTHLVGHRVSCSTGKSEVGWIGVASSSTYRARFSTPSISPMLTATLPGVRCCPHAADEEISERLSNFPRVTQLARGGGSGWSVFYTMLSQLTLKQACVP